MPEFDAVLKAMRARLETEKANNASLLVRIGGKSCSGKSFLSEKIKNEFEAVTIIYLDNYTRGKKELSQNLSSNAVVNWDTPECIDIEAAVRDVHLVLSGKEIMGKTFNYSVDEPSKDIKVKLVPNRIIILEGIFALDTRLEVAGCFDIYNHHSNFSMLIRRMIRSREFTPSYDFEYMLKIGISMSLVNIESKMLPRYQVVNNEYVAAREMPASPLISYQKTMDDKFVFNSGKITSRITLFWEPKEANIFKDNQQVSVWQEGEHYHFNYTFLSLAIAELAASCMQPCNKMHKISFIISPVLLGLMSTLFHYAGQCRSDVFTETAQDFTISYRSNQVSTIDGVQKDLPSEILVDLNAVQCRDSDYMTRVTETLGTLFSKSTRQNANVVNERFSEFRVLYNA